ncbi:MAG: ABC transporter ATP-binding protein [Chloroflexota bacterium]
MIRSIDYVNIIRKAVQQFVDGQKPLWSLVRILPQVQARLTLALAFFIVISVILSIAFTLTVGLLIGAVPDVLDDQISSRWYLPALIIAVVSIFTFQRIVPLLQHLLSDSLGRHLEAYVEAQLMQSALSTGRIDYLEDPANHDIFHGARGAIQGQYPPTRVVRGLTDFVTVRLNILVTSIVVMYVTYWWLPVILLIILFVVRFFVRKHTFDRIESRSGSLSQFRRSTYFLELAISPEYAKETRIFNLTDWIIHHFRVHWHNAVTVLRGGRHARTLAHMPWIICVVLVTLCSTFALVGYATSIGAFSLTSSVIAAQSLLRLSLNTLNISSSELWLEYGTPSIVMAASVNMPTSQYSVTEKPTDVLSQDCVKQAIRFNQVTFTYDSSHVPVLQNVNMTISAGSSCAIVGANGAGKTTLIKLLTGLYTPTMGNITVDGTDLTHISPAVWRQHISVVFQDFMRYELSARENIGLGAIQYRDDYDALECAARKAGALDIIRQLPHGWDTILSRHYKDGVELSGGQWQRIALARALFAVEAGASVLILDEPTASLDIRAEAAFFEQFLELTSGLTVILISHRFSTVRHVDTIHVLEGGGVIEQGSHEELLQTNGRYTQMYTLQSSKFRSSWYSEKIV